jgi:hypothetical protein
MASATPDGWTVTNFAGCSDTWAALTAAQQALALRLAAFTVYSLTGRQFGTVTLTLRPCNAPGLPPLYQTYPVNLLNPWGTDEGSSYYPVYMQSLSRQGVSVQFPSVDNYLDRGLTGLNEVDQLIVQFNPGRLAQSPKVFSMDQSPIRTTTLP